LPETKLNRPADRGTIITTMGEVGRILLMLGVLLAATGAVLLLLARTGFRGLPGDIAYQNRGVSIYFPIVTCIVLSILLTAGAWLWRWMSGGR
jgi:hypothetical protein